MVRFLLYLLILNFLSSSCSKNKLEISGKNISSFPPPVILDGVKIDTESYNIYKPFYLDFIDSILIVSTFNDSSLIAVFDKKGDFKTSFGRRGRGPSELGEYAGIYDYEIEENIFVTTFDINLLVLDRIDLTKSISHNQLNIEATYEFPSDLRRVSTSFLINQNRAFGIYEGQVYKNLDEKTGLYFLNLLNGKFETKQLPNLDFKESVFKKNSYSHYVTRLNSRRADLSPSNKNFAIIMRYVPFLQIYGVDGSKFTTLENFYLDGRTNLPNFEIDLFEENKYPAYYLDVTASDNNIYLLKNADLISGSTKKKSHIEILSWEGDPIGLYEIPAKYDLNVFTVNEKDSVFYGLSYSQDTLYRFDFSKKER